MLPQHRPDPDLVGVDVPWNSPPGSGSHELPDQLVAGEDADDLRRIGVEVEQAPARRHGGIEIARIVEPELRLDVVIAGAEPDHAGAMGQAEAATVNPVSRVFHAGYGASGQEIEKTRDVARRPVREPKLDAREINSASPP
jgi:hypothetical protein